jgi:hypothetical protein
MTMRLAIQLGLAVLSAVLFLVTLVWHDWIEVVFGVEPDQGSGALEWILVAALAVAAVLFGLLARAEWRRARPVSSSEPTG